MTDESRWHTGTWGTYAIATNAFRESVEIFFNPALTLDCEPASVRALLYKELRLAILSITQCFRAFLKIREIGARPPAETQRRKFERPVECGFDIHEFIRAA